MRTFLRVVYRLCVFIVASFVCLFQFAVLRLGGALSLKRRADWLQSWCRLGLRVIGTSLEVDGPAPQRGLIVSNHLSYLDILVYSALDACVFVSKREVRSWPIFGWIASLAGSIYIDRGKPGDTHRVSREMMDALAGDRPVMLFPEGTSSDGNSVLRFHSSLFEAAVAAETPITAAYLSYTASNGSVENDVCFWGKVNFATHILRLFAIEHVQARVRFSPDSHVFQDRKMAAAAMYAEVVSLSGLRADGQGAM
jgi:1-acyl-sn-glycerol-3-phosphate acyltransferase